jgi:hypothetical protein
MRLVGAVALVVVTSACGGSGGTSQAPTASQAAGQTAGQAVLQIGVMVHLEGWGDDNNRARFEEHAGLVREYATLFEKHGAKLTWESKELTEGSIRWDDNVLLEMQQRGHGVGVHADIGGQTTYDCARFADDLRAEKVQLESLGVVVRHVSGIVSHCDWVTTAADAGYLFTTGLVAYAVMSMPVEQRPAEYRNCKTPAACHDTFPAELADRIHPWRADDGTNWLTDDRDGRLVILPASGGLAHMDEDASGANPPGGNWTYTQADLDAFFAELDAALALAKPGQVNTYYLSWSLGAQLDRELLEKWLQGIESYVQSGRVKWSSLPEMYDSYVAWEQSH